jgi:hypothetical protein
LNVESKIMRQVEIGEMQREEIKRLNKVNEQQSVDLESSK